MKKLLVALALLFAPSAAWAQCNGVFPNNTICGNVSGAGALPKPVPNSALTGVPGGTSGQTQYNNGGTTFGGYTPSGDVAVVPSTGVETIQPGVVTNAKLASGAANTTKGSLTGSAEVDLTMVSCSAIYQLSQWVTGTGWQCATNLVLPSRAIAASLNLSAFTTVHTLGYTTPADGGEATFKNVASASFIDSFISTFTTQGSTGCTNNAYTGVIWTKSGNPSLVIGTATAAGGTVTAVSIYGTPGNGFSVGDVLTTGSIPGCSPTITVTAITPPQASFIDTASTHFQFVPSGPLNVLQFGAIGDWNGTDGSATNNFTQIQAAVHFAGYKSSTSFDAGGYWGGRVYVPSGSYKMCGASYFVLDEAVILEGASATGATLRVCDTYTAALNTFTICDPVWAFACFTAQYRNISFSASRTLAGNSNIFMIYSNNVQDFGGLYNVYIYPGQRGCVDFEKGYGGASTVFIEKLSCNQGSVNNVMVKIGNTPGSGLNFGSTIVSLKDLVLAGPSSGQQQLQPALQILGGFTSAENVHCEIITEACVQISVPSSANGEQINLKNVNSQGVATSQTCNGVVELVSGNNPGNTIIQSVPVSSTCTNTIANGQAGGSNFTAQVRGPTMCVSGACAAAIP